MDRKTYYIRRNKLIEEFLFLKEKHLPRSAAARVREIAKLDHEFTGEDIEKVKRNFYYDQLMK